MAQIGLDLPAGEAACFDKAYLRFIGDRLLLRPDIDTQLVSYPINGSVERRVVSMSCPDHLNSFTSSWRSLAN